MIHFLVAWKEEMLHHVFIAISLSGLLPFRCMPFYFLLWNRWRTKTSEDLPSDHVFTELSYCYQRIVAINTLHIRTSARPSTDVAWMITVWLKYISFHHQFQVFCLTIHWTSRSSFPRSLSFDADGATEPVSSSCPAGRYAQHGARSFGQRCHSHLDALGSRIWWFCH